MIEVNQNIIRIGFKAQWVYEQVNNFLTIQARELKFCVWVCYLRGKSAHLTNFQPLERKLVILVILFAGRHSPKSPLLHPP